MKHARRIIVALVLAAAMAVAGPALAGIGTRSLG
jgi:hypothetical protein